jgi:CRISPR-associated DxTHG motif protein
MSKQLQRPRELIYQSNYKAKHGISSCSKVLPVISLLALYAVRNFHCNQQAPEKATVKLRLEISHGIRSLPHLFYQAWI